MLIGLASQKLKGSKLITYNALHLLLINAETVMPLWRREALQIQQLCGCFAQM